MSSCWLPIWTTSHNEWHEKNVLIRVELLLNGARNDFGMFVALNISTTLCHTTVCFEGQIIIIIHYSVFTISALFYHSVTILLLSAHLNFCMNISMFLMVCCVLCSVQYVPLLLLGEAEDKFPLRWTIKSFYSTLLSKLVSPWQSFQLALWWKLKAQR